MRTRRLLIGIGSSILGRGFSLLAPMIIFPSALLYLGDAKFGFWMTILSLTSMSLFVDLGIGNGLMTKLSECHGKDDSKTAQTYISTAYVALSFVAGALLLIFGLSRELGLQPSRLLSVPIYDLDYDSIASLTLVGFIIGIPISIIQRIQYANQQVWISNSWQAGGAAISVICTLTAIRFQQPVWVVVGIYTAIPLSFMSLSTLYYFLRQKQNLRPHLSLVKWLQAKSLLILGCKFMSLSIITAIALNVDNLIIANNLSLADVTGYALPAKVISLLGILMTAICLPMWPANGEAIARGDYVWVRNTTFRISWISGAVVGGAAVVLNYFSNELMQLWMGKIFESQGEVFILLSVQSVLTAIVSPYFMVLNSLGITRIQMLAWCLFLIASVSAKILIVDLYGLVGIAAAGAVCYFFTIVPLVILSVRKVICNGLGNI